MTHHPLSKYFHPTQQWVVTLRALEDMQRIGPIAYQCDSSNNKYNIKRRRFLADHGKMTPVHPNRCPPSSYRWVRLRITLRDGCCWCTRILALRSDYRVWNLLDLDMPLIWLRIRTKLLNLISSVPAIPEGHPRFSKSNLWYPKPQEKGWCRLFPAL